MLAIIAVATSLIREIAIALIALLVAGCSGKPDDPRPVIATTTSYLECAVRDLAGNQSSVARLLPPGCCPGHLDVSPAILDKLARARLLLRFEFQSSLDDKLQHFCDNEGFREIGGWRAERRLGLRDHAGTPAEVRDRRVSHASAGVCAGQKRGQWPGGTVLRARMGTRSHSTGRSVGHATWTL